MPSKTAEQMSGPVAGRQITDLAHDANLSIIIIASEKNTRPLPNQRSASLATQRAWDICNSRKVH